MFSPTPAGQDAPSAQRHGVRRILPYIIVFVAMCMMSGYVWVGWNIMQSQPDFSETYVTDPEQVADVAFPDGSTMQLQGTATVMYSAKSRKVTLLSGKATFNVVGGNVPFDVVAGKARISAQGRQFAVNNHRTGQAFAPVDIIAMDGNVAVMRDSVWLWQTKTLLQPGQTVQVDAKANVGEVSLLAQ